MVVRPAITECYKIGGFQLQRGVDVMGVNVVRRRPLSSVTNLAMWMLLQELSPHFRPIVAAFERG